MGNVMMRALTTSMFLLSAAATTLTTTTFEPTSTTTATDAKVLTPLVSVLGTIGIIGIPALFILLLYCLTRPHKEKNATKSSRVPLVSVVSDAANNNNASSSATTDETALLAPDTEATTEHSSGVESRYHTFARLDTRNSINNGTTVPTKRKGFCCVQ